PEPGPQTGTSDFTEKGPGPGEEKEKKARKTKSRESGTWKRGAAAAGSRWKAVRPRWFRRRTGYGVDAKPAAGGLTEAVRIRPRYGAYWITVTLIVVWALTSLAAVYSLWPRELPAEFMLLLLFPMIAAPVIARDETLRFHLWLWAVCALPFAAAVALALTEADDGEFRALAGSLAALTVAGLGLAVMPLIIMNGRGLDRLLGPDVLQYEIFNVPGAGLDDPSARQAAETSGAELQQLAAIDGVRIVHGLVPPQLPGKPVCYVDHAVMRDKRLALVMTRRWPAAHYTWTNAGVFSADGVVLPGADTGAATAVKGLRRVIPLGVRVRVFVAVLPADPDDSGRAVFTPPRRATVGAGELEQVRAQIAEWLEGTRPVVRRRLLASLVPHIRQPGG
ncbi:MAG TPA: hypothetical protein VIL71_19710, partial [Spirillospora sp.]